MDYSISIKIISYIEILNYKIYLLKRIVKVIHIYVKLVILDLQDLLDNNNLQLLIVELRYIWLHRSYQVKIMVNKLIYGHSECYYTIYFLENFHSKE